MENQTQPKELVPLKIGLRTIYIAPDRDPEYITSLYLIFHQPRWAVNKDFKD